MPIFSQQIFVDWQGIYAADNIRSQGWIMPLPLEVGEFLQRASAGFGGDQFIQQFRTVGTNSEPKRNICGSLTFRRRDMSVNSPDTGMVGNRILEFDYVFANTAIEPAVKLQAVVNITNGSQPADQNGLTDRTASYLFYPEGAEGPKVKRGENNLSRVVDHSYLRGIANTWKSKPSELKRRTSFATARNGLTPHQSDSSEGNECSVVPGIQWANITLPEGNSTWIGTPDGTSGNSGREPLVSWGGTVRAGIITTTRKNSPSLIDTQPGRPTAPMMVGEIYNESKTDSYLSDEIFERIWLDTRGRFDPNQSALDNIGWCSSTQDSGITSTSDVSYIGKVSLMSADGKDYRVTVRSGSDPAQGTQSTHLVSIDNPASIALERLKAGAYVITKIEVFDDGWKDVTGTVTVSDHPGPNVGLLEVRKSRKGSRFGFRAYAEGANNIVANRYFLSQQFEHWGRAATEQ